jgi:hypothetical protein
MEPVSKKIAFQPEGIMLNSRFIMILHAAGVRTAAVRNNKLVFVLSAFFLLIVMTIPCPAAADAVTATTDKQNQQNQPVVSDKCAELTSRLDIDLKEVVRAGCKPSQAQISKLMDNPVGNLVIISNQFNWIQLKGSGFEGSKDAYVYKLIPTFPISLGDSWNLINRPIFAVPSVPVKKEVGQLIGMSAAEVIHQPALLSTVRDPFGRTTGFGDFTYVGLASPKKPDRIGDGILVWGVGPTLIFPTASEDVLGQGKYQAGPAAVAAYIGKKWAFGLFPQHWWSFTGDSDRNNTSTSNIQYFIYYNITDTVKIGMSPNVTIDWKAESGEQVTLPVGLGVNWMTKMGKLPVRLGVEGYYSIIHPHDSMSSRLGVRFTITPVIPTFLF